MQLPLSFSFVLALTFFQLLSPINGYSESSSQSPYKLGWIGSLTGPLQKYGANQAALLAVEDINAAGGVLGKPLELVQEDTQSKGVNAVTAFRKLRSLYGIKFIVGGHATPETLPIAPLTRDQEVLTVAAITGSPKFTGISPHAIRITANSTIAGNLMARHAYESAKFRRVAVFVEETDYAVPVAEEFQKIFQASGGIIPFFDTFQSKETDFRSFLTKIQNQKVDALYLGTQGPDTASLLVEQMRELGLHIPIYGNEQVGSARLSHPEAASHFAGIIFAEPLFDKTTPKTHDFIERYKSRYHVQDLPLGIFTAEAYDAVRLLAEAISRCGDDVEKVRACLVATRNYPGVSGPVTIGADGDGQRTYVLKRIDTDGNAAIVQQ